MWTAILYPEQTPDGDYPNITMRLGKHFNQAYNYLYDTYGDNMELVIRNMFSGEHYLVRKGKELVLSKKPHSHSIRHIDFRIKVNNEIIGELEYLR